MNTVSNGGGGASAEATGDASSGHDVRMNGQSNPKINRANIARVEPIIRPYVRRTPVVETDSSDFGLAPFTLCLKLELLQHSGSFKTRGAFVNLLTRQIPRAGVVAASGGNHGAAVAYAAMTLGLPATIFVPSISSPAKVQRIRDYGAELVISGERYADALAASREWGVRSGALEVHAFDQTETLLGQGTVGMEMEQSVADLDALLVPVGGGGLIGGIAAWCAGRTRIVGVEPEAAPTLHRALEAGHPVDAPAGGIAADSLAPKQVGALVFPIAESYVDQVVLVPDSAIHEAQKLLWNKVRIACEPGGAAAFAALSSGGYQPRPGDRVGVIISGGNTVAVDFDRH